VYVDEVVVVVSVLVSCIGPLYCCTVTLLLRQYKCD
jgi:hypothetical protein